MALWAQPAADVQLQVDVARYATTMGITILFYDYTLTFSTEFDRYWTKGASWASILFFLNRYLSAGEIMLLVEDFRRSSQEECRMLHKYHQILAIVIQFVIGVSQVLRTYAVYNRSFKILAFLVVTGLAAVGVALLAVLGDQSDSHDYLGPEPVSGCLSPLDKQQSIGLAIAWSGLLAFDSVVFGLMLWKYVRQRSFLARGTLMHDGTMYFGIMAITYIFTIASFIVAPPALRSVGVAPANFLATTLMSRLMLNIRDPRLHRYPDTAIGGTSGSTSLDIRMMTITQSNDESAGAVRVVLDRRYNDSDVEMQQISSMTDGTNVRGPVHEHGTCQIIRSEAERESIGDVLDR